MNKVILGLDPGFGRLGFGAISIEHGKTKVLDYGVITTSPHSAFSDRLVQIAGDLEELIRQLKPSKIVVEKLFFAKNAKTAMQVAEARGVIVFVIARHRIPLFEYTPAQVKNAVTGDGKADKKAVTKMIKLLLHLKNAPKIDDASDALAIALTASVFC